MNQQYKYLEEIGLQRNECMLNWTDKEYEDDARVKEWEKEAEEIGFDPRECWNLDNTMTQWIYSHLRQYVEDAKDVVDLETDYYTYELDGESYNLREAIDFITTRLADYLTYDEIGKPWLETLEKMEEVRQGYRMLAEIWQDLWW